MTFSSKSPRAACKSGKKNPPPRHFIFLSSHHQLPTTLYFFFFTFLFVFVVECAKLQRIYAYQVLFLLSFDPLPPILSTQRFSAWPTSAVYGYLGAGTKFPGCSRIFLRFQVGGGGGGDAGIGGIKNTYLQTFVAAPLTHSRITMRSNRIRQWAKLLLTGAPQAGFVPDSPTKAMGS